MLMKALNKVLGMLVGAVTGYLAAILFIFYAYYLLIKTMREANYSWATTILATLTIGHIGALISLLSSFASPFYGIVVGFNKGLVNALMLPLNLPLEIHKYLVFMCADTPLSRETGSESIWREMVKSFICLGAFSFGKIIIALTDSSEVESTIEYAYVSHQAKKILSQLTNERILRQRPDITSEQFAASLARSNQLLDRARSLLNSRMGGRVWSGIEVNERLCKNQALFDRVKALSTENTGGEPIRERVNSCAVTAVEKI